LILHTDAEQILAESEDYYRWLAEATNKKCAVILPKIFDLAIEEYYRIQIKQGYNLQDIPLIMPLVPFPSTEILVMATKIKPSDSFSPYRSQSATELKRKLYPQYPPSVQVTLKAITLETCGYIYQGVPEFRFFFETLFYQKILA